MLKSFREKALDESAMRADKLAAAGDSDGAATWILITTVVGQLANNTLHARCTDPKTYYWRKRPQ